MGRTDKLFRIFATTAGRAEGRLASQFFRLMAANGDIFESHSGLMAGKEPTAGTHAQHRAHSLQGSTPTLPLQYPESKPHLKKLAVRVRDSDRHRLRSENLIQQNV